MAFRQPDDTFAQVACQANDVGPFPFPWVAFSLIFSTGRACHHLLWLSNIDATCEHRNILLDVLTTEFVPGHY